MEKKIIEYVWLDGYNPEPNLRSKTKIIEHILEHPKLMDIPLWSYDGSSTKQAEGHFSDCVLKPVKLYNDPTRGNNCYIALCEVLNPDGSPHISNHRTLIKENQAFSDNRNWWFGFEQEYVLIDNNTNLPLGFQDIQTQDPQGKYYCGVGSKQVNGRYIVEEHMNVCLASDLDITGINAEVLFGQWEFQLLGKGAKNACDDLWVARYLLERISEKYNVSVDYQPKPLKGDWNGSGMHTNFSSYKMRTVGGKEYFEKIFKALEENHKEHIAVYGSNNEERLTGKHETCSINQFRVGVSDRGASIRIPPSVNETWKGYLEDRRPSANANPYQIVKRIIDTITNGNRWDC